LGLGLSLVKNAAVINTLIFIRKAPKYVLGLRITIRHPTVKLIGDREAEQTYSCLTVGLDRKDVATDRLGFTRFVEISIDLSLGDRLRDSSP